MGTEWVLSGYCNVAQQSPQHLNVVFSSTVLYRTSFGASCLEVDAAFVQAFLDYFGAGLEAHGALDQVGCDMPAALCLMNK